MAFYNVILPFVMFDIIESFDFVNDVFQGTFQWGDSDLDELNIYDQTQTLGYDSHNPLLNLGTMTIVMVYYLIKIIILFTCIYRNRHKKGCCKSSFKSLMTAMLFGDLLTIFIETHLELGIAGSVMM